MKSGATAIALLLLAATSTGCTSGEDNASATRNDMNNPQESATETPPTPPPGNHSADSRGGSSLAPAAEPQTPPELAAYAGKAPFEAVDGVAFLGHPVVRAEVKKVVSDPVIRKWVLEAGSSPWHPLFVKSGQIVAVGCQQHACDRRAWAVVIDMETHAARVCYEHNSQSRWYSAEGIQPQDGDCALDEKNFDG